MPWVELEKLILARVFGSASYPASSVWKSVESAKLREQPGVGIGQIDDGWRKCRNHDEVLSTEDLYPTAGATPLAIIPLRQLLNPVNRPALSWWGWLGTTPRPRLQVSAGSCVGRYEDLAAPTRPTWVVAPISAQEAEPPPRTMSLGKPTWDCELWAEDGRGFRCSRPLPVPDHGGLL
jgi:hypothetical protein